MKTAQELRKIAANAKIEEKSTLENSQAAIEHFTKDLQTMAERGKFFKRTTCIVSITWLKFYCQTENDGSGFTIDNIDEVIKLIEDQGFKVEMERKRGYCPFNISWE